MLCINDDDENDFITRNLRTEGVFIENGLQGHDCPAAWATPRYLNVDVVPEDGLSKPLLLRHGGAWEVTNPLYDLYGVVGSCACEAPPIKKTASPTAAPTAQCAESGTKAGQGADATESEERADDDDDKSPVSLGPDARVREDLHLGVVVPYSLCVGKARTIKDRTDYSQPPNPQMDTIGAFLVHGVFCCRLRAKCAKCAKCFQPLSQVFWWSLFGVVQVVL